MWNDYLNKKTAVLCGGSEENKEREVSLRSGQAVHEAFNQAGIETDLIDLKDYHYEYLKNTLADYGRVFIALHGGWGEDGRLQEMLSIMKIRYTGSGKISSALAMDKSRSRNVFKSYGINIPEGFVNKYDPSLGDDIVVKPACGGSTVGVTIIHGVTRAKLDEAVKSARENYSGDIIFEKYIPGRELTVAVIESNYAAMPLPVIEIKPHEGFYNYENKYTHGATEYIAPAELDIKTTFQAQMMAVKAHKNLGCSSYSRTDLRLSDDGKLYALEINTAPGMTETSLVPKAAAAVGISMPELVKMILETAHV